MTTMPSQASYDTIPMVASTSDAAHTDLQNDRGRGLSLHAKIGLVVIGAAALLFAVTGRTPQQSKVGRTTDPLLEVVTAGVPRAVEAKARPCTFDECYDTHCNQDLAPYTCLFHNGGPHGGCSATPWLEGTCSEQCDLRGCVDLPIPDDTDGCDVPCTPAWCASPQLCGPKVPFQCTAGSSRFGCSGDALMWTLRSSSTTCSSCCNIRTCS